MTQLNATKLYNIRRYYERQVRYIEENLKHLGAAMPDPDYKVTGTFYVMADLSDLYGLEIPKKACQALNCSGIIATDEHIAYTILFSCGLMLSPLSYYGVSDQAGFLRITCSGGMQEQKEIIDRLEKNA